MDIGCVRRTLVDELENDDKLPGESVKYLQGTGQLSGSNSNGSASLMGQTACPEAEGYRWELVWKPMNAPSSNATLADISHEFQDLFKVNLLTTSSPPALRWRRGRYVTRALHRCPGYKRFEITLTSLVKSSGIVVHSSPVPQEICLVCKQVVKDDETFRCACGRGGTHIPCACIVQFLSFHNRR